MLKIEDIVSNVKVYGLEESIRRAKFSMSTDVSKLSSELTNGIAKLAQAKPGSGHDNWLKGVIVQFDLTFSNKVWPEAERYHFLEFVSSQSTMHRITKFNLDNAYMEYVDPRIIGIMKDKVQYYNSLKEASQFWTLDRMTQEEIDAANTELTETYLKILYSNPAGFKLCAGMTTNYLQLKTIYQQRKNHKLPEWRVFCKWIETLPHAELITSKGVEL